MTEDFVVKYAWSAAGYLLISIPVFFKNVLPSSVVGLPLSMTLDNPSLDDESHKVARRTEGQRRAAQQTLYTQLMLVSQTTSRTGGSY